MKKILVLAASCTVVVAGLFGMAATINAFPRPLNASEGYVLYINVDESGNVEKTPEIKVL